MNLVLIGNLWVKIEIINAQTDDVLFWPKNLGHFYETTNWMGCGWSLCGVPFASFSLSFSIFLFISCHSKAQRRKAVQSDCISWWRTVIGLNVTSTGNRRITTLQQKTFLQVIFYLFRWNNTEANPPLVLV